MSQRLNAMCSMPVILMSSTYVPRPWISRGSSRRLTRSPISLGRTGVAVAMATSRLSATMFRGVLDRVDDVLIAGAAAEVAGDAFANLLLARRRLSCSRLTADMIMPGVQ